MRWVRLDRPEQHRAVSRGVSRVRRHRQETVSLARSGRAPLSFVQRTRERLRSNVGALSHVSLTVIAAVIAADLLRRRRSASRPNSPRLDPLAMLAELDLAPADGRSSPADPSSPPDAADAGRDRGPWPPIRARRPTRRRADAGRDRGPLAPMAIVARRSELAARRAWRRSSPAEASSPPDRSDAAADAGRDRGPPRPPAN